MTKLVLFTSSYPNNNGDAPFINNEIHELAQAFDEITIFQMHRPSGETLELPPNVTSVHSLAMTRSQLLRQLMHVNFRDLRSSASSCGAILRGDLKRVRSLKHVRELLRAVVSGRAMAKNPALQAALRDPDSVHYHFWGMGSAFIVPWLAPRRTFVRLNGYDLYERQGYLPVREAIFQRTTKVLVVSKAGLRYMSNKYAQFSDKFELSHLGTQDAGTGPAAPSQVTLVSCSNLIPLKRVEILARAVVELAQTTPVTWTHFGEGETRGEVEAVLSAAPSTLKISLPGYVANSEVLKFLRTEPVTAMVLLSESEGGVPVSLNEATSFGVPIIATEVGGVPEIFEANPAVGVMLPESVTPADVVAAVQHIVLNPPDRDLIRSTWNETFNAHKQTQNAIRIMTTPDAPAAPKKRSTP